MSQPAKAPEPTMEEILASIRRIIADDDFRPPPAKPALAQPASVQPPPAQPASIEAVAEPVTTIAAVDGFDDPQVSNVAANDVFELRGSSPAEFPDARDTAGPQLDAAPPAPWPHFGAPEPVSGAEPAKFIPTGREPPVPDAAKPAMPSGESARPPRLEAFRSDVVKVELAKLELARSEFAKSELAKSELARSEAAKSEAANIWPGPAKPDSAGPASPRPDMAWRDPMRPDQMRPPGAAPAPALRGSGEEALLSPRTMAAVDVAFNTLAQKVLVHNSRSLEDLVREMLKPMLKAWLDDNLPGLVERLVRAEIERVARGRS